MDQTNEAKLLLELFHSSRNNNIHNNTSNTRNSTDNSGNNNNNNNNSSSSIHDSNSFNNNSSSNNGFNTGQYEHTTTPSNTGDARTTQEDLRFLKLANEVIQSTNLKSKIDPTISTLLQRAQYFAAPHGGSPINNLIYQRSGSTSSSHQQQHHQQQQQPQAQHSTFPDLSLNAFTPKSDHFSQQQQQQDQQQQHQSQQQQRGDADDEDDDDELREDEKPFICSKCLLSFRRSSDLKRHEKTHLEVLPNVCKLCHKGFARKDALKRHIETLTCRRNRERLLQSLGISNNEEEKNIDLDVILQRNGVQDY